MMSKTNRQLTDALALVTPAQAGVQFWRRETVWIPACAGMTTQTLIANQ